MALGVYLLSQSAHNLSQTLVELENGPTEAVLSWLPPGAIGQGMIAVRDGQWGLALAHLLVAAAGIGVALAVWAWAIRRRVRGSSGRPASRGAQQASTESTLVPVPLTALRPSPTVASAAQQARYYFFRSPRAVQSAALPAVMGARPRRTRSSPTVDLWRRRWSSSCLALLSSLVQPVRLR